MSTYRQIYYQIVFSTRHREPTIDETHEQELYKYIWGIIDKHKCKLYRINSMPDHIHIFSDLHPSVALSDYVKDIKVASSLWMKESGKFPLFSSWQEGYGAFTYSQKEKDRVIDYIKNKITPNRIFLMNTNSCCRNLKLNLTKNTCYEIVQPFQGWLPS